MLDLWRTHPTGWNNPVILRVSAALPAAGAWDAAPVVSSSAGAQHLTLNFSFTRGAAGGAFSWYLDTSLYSIAANVPAGAQQWAQESLYASGAVVPGTDATSTVQREIQSYTPTGAAAESFVFGPIALHGTVERIRLFACESGNVANPGTLQVTAEMYL